MNVCMVGLGRLGLPVSCAMALRGHHVYGYDTDTEKIAHYRRGHSGLYEPDMDPILAYCLSKSADDDCGGQLHLCPTLAEAVPPSEIIFVAVPTPSRPDGAFDTSIVCQALAAVAQEMRQDPSGRYRVIAVISTVLPLSCRFQFLPLLQDVLGPPGDTWGFCYNAQFIAMGRVIEDMLNPEFVLIGQHDPWAGDLLEQFYAHLVSAPLLRLTLEEAEIVKLTYNTFIGQKIVLGNTIMELCHKIPHANCDVVSHALSLARKRIVSAWYLQGGMGDGGPCHGRDARAMDYLARQLHLSANPFAFVSQARHDQTAYLADLVQQEHASSGLPIAILGLTFKPDTDLTDDSPSLLLLELLQERGLSCFVHDAILYDHPHVFRAPHLYVLCTRHPAYREVTFPPGSTIVDVWRFYRQGDPGLQGCRLVSIGAGT